MVVPGFTAQDRFCVVGCGLTGWSVVRYLRQFTSHVAVTDSRECPPKQADCQTEFADLKCVFGEVCRTLCCDATVLVVSPGVPPTTPAIVAARARGVRIVCDVALFAAARQRPLIAITGSNGKTTVTTLLGQALQAAGKSVIVCGNIGLPVLEALQQAPPDFYVCELSSFQLYYTDHLAADVAVLLNISPDHIDWHGDFKAYEQAKLKISHGCQKMIIEQALRHLLPSATTTFSVTEPADMSCIETDVGRQLAWQGQPLLPVSHCQQTLPHQISNVLAVAAVITALDLPLTQPLAACVAFKGLPHRCQWVRSVAGVDWYNDSKATNVASACASVAALSASGRSLVLIVGGQSKAAELSALMQYAPSLRAVLALGEDRTLFAALFGRQVPVSLVESMQEAVHTAQQLAQPGDAVLLAPACASFDMFSGYAARGDCFMQHVSALADAGEAS